MREHNQSQSVLKGPFFESNLKYLTVFVFFAFMSKSVNNQWYNKYIFGNIFSSSIKNGSTKTQECENLSRQFQVENALFFQPGIVCYKFSNSCVFVESFFVE